jgi:16S rRNA A1518/A1519 N6-dimethyltransferase RsmA/KsgA/DIM1 with predicted DNA glycosylase/AP lyase activity
MLKKLLREFGGVDDAFRAASIPDTARAEELALEQWITLANAVGAKA